MPCYLDNPPFRPHHTRRRCQHHCPQSFRCRWFHQSMFHSLGGRCRWHQDPSRLHCNCKRCCSDSPLLRPHRIRYHCPRHCPRPYRSHRSLQSTFHSPWHRRMSRRHRLRSHRSCTHCCSGNRQFRPRCTPRHRRRHWLGPCLCHRLPLSRFRSPRGRCTPHPNRWHSHCSCMHCCSGNRQFLLRHTRHRYRRRGLLPFRCRPSHCLRTHRSLWRINTWRNPSQKHCSCTLRCSGNRQFHLHRRRHRYRRRGR